MKIIRGMYAVISDIVSIPFVVLSMLIILIVGCVKGIQHKNWRCPANYVCEYIVFVKTTLFYQWNWVKTGLMFVITD